MSQRESPFLRSGRLRVRAGAVGVMAVGWLGFAAAAVAGEGSGELGTVFGRGVKEPVGLYLVDRFDDNFFANDCLTAEPDDCSLRGALARANTDGVGSVIRIPGGVYPLTTAGSEEDGGVTGDLDVHDGGLVLTAFPAGDHVVIEQQVPDRILDLHADAGLVRVFGEVTFRGGSAMGPPGQDRGGSIRFVEADGLELRSVHFEGASAGNSGGCLQWQGPTGGGTLSLFDVSFEGCEAVQSGGAFAIFLGTSVGSFDGVSVRGNMAGLQGGGGFVTGGPSAFVFERTTFEGNTVASAANLSRGGGVYFFGGNVVIDESTFARNVAGGLGGDAAGGAVMAIGTSLLLRNSTLSRNRVETTATFGTEIAAESSAAIRLEFTTVVPWDTAAANTVALAAGSSFEALASIVGGQCAGGGSFTSLGFNVERPPSGSTSTQCGLTHVSDVQAPGPLLRPLAGYGGPTLTHAVLPEGLGWTFLVPSVQCPAADQRGALRSSLFCHAGAFEAETLAPGPWIFSDGFESGDASAWPVVLPGGSS